MNQLVEKCLTILCKYQIIDLTSVEIQSIDFNPKVLNGKIDLAVRIHKMPFDIKREFVFKNEIISRCIFIGNYINFIYNKEVLLKALDSIFCPLTVLEKTDKFLVIEHTSLTPVYPVNLSTFRSTVVGNSLACLYEQYSNKNVSRAFFMNDTARNLRLLSRIIDKEYFYNDEKLVQSKYKTEIVGKLYTTAVCINKNTYDVNCLRIIDKLFLAQDLCEDYFDNVEDMYNSGEKLECIQDVVSYMVDGFNEFFARYKILPVEYHYSSLLKHVEGGSEYLQQTDYFRENVNYYFSLLKPKVSCISVINKRQEQLLSKVKKYLCKEELSFVFVEDVYVQDVNQQLRNDKISDLCFHSVDVYLQIIKDKYPQYDEAFLREALIFDIISRDVNEKIVYPADGSIDFSFYSKLIGFINNTQFECVEPPPDQYSYDYDNELIELLSIANFNVQKAIENNSVKSVCDYIHRLLKTSEYVTNKSILFPCLRKTLYSLLCGLGIK